jgi:hypothetical protein
MAYELKKTLIYGAVGIIIATSIIMAVQFMPIPLLPETGILVLKITDDPPYTKPTSLNITIDSIMVHQEGDGDEAWSTFDIDGNLTYDLVELETAVDVMGADEFSIGDYDQIRMHVIEATADLPGEEGVELSVPSEYIKINVKFSIKEGKTTIILLDVTYDSVQVSADHNLRPVVHPTVEKQP